MEIIYSEKVEVLGESQVFLARNKAVSFSQKLGFSEENVGRVALVTVELAKNIVKHSDTGGTLLFRSLFNNKIKGMEILALDKGPGMENVANCIQDGFSTAGSMGIGLGCVVRLSDYYSVYSQAGKGTVFLSQLWPEAPSLKQMLSPSLGAVCLAKPGEEACGDAWAVSVDDNSILILVCDGLGHGSGASEASVKAVQAFRKVLIREPVLCLEDIHRSLRPTRGAVAAIAKIMPKAGKINFCGVGNISAVISFHQGRRHMTSNNGVLGHSARNFQEFSYTWPKEGVLILHSDGLVTSWNLEGYRGIMAKHPSVIAGLLYRDYLRGRDDVAVVVIKP